MNKWRRSKKQTKNRTENEIDKKNFFHITTDISNSKKEKTTEKKGEGFEIILKARSPL
jgi:hypothetical protein